MRKIAVFASGSGSNAENIYEFFNCKKKDDNGEADCIAKVELIITNKKDAYVLERAKRLGVESVVFEKEKWTDGLEVLDYLKSKDIDFIVLAGFLLKVPPAIISHYPMAIVNIHPALLPKFGGKGMYGDNVHKAVIEAKEVKSGITIHYVNENYDEGDIIFKSECDVTSTDDFNSLATKVHELEYAHFPKVIEDCIKNSLK